MKRFFTLVGLTAGFGLLSRPVHSQQPAQAPAKEYRYTETMPVFPGGLDQLKAIIRDSLRYPAQALREGVAGKVLVQFTVSPEGRTTDVSLKQGVRADLDREALRVVGLFNHWTWQPATQNGRPVSVVYTMPVTFGVPGVASQVAAGPDSLDLLPLKGLQPALNYWSPDRGIIPPDKGIVYGSCVQRLGFSSGGFGQYVRLVNLGTGKAVRLEVKPAFKSARSNSFCFAVPPGRYALHFYEYTESKWYGGETFTENLRKAANPANAVAATRYVFTVAAGQVHYLGTWHFEQPGQPRFTDDKADLDARLRGTYKKLPFDAARTALPQ
ncbi:energy transducer TonB [Hymenobacter latericus]|uniref:energy transducer TonB n=1 Tax=Hymenobacter sp. YIM 151858-1 TaxID=2987688 RepID=UPI0022271860|nr:energy transducer TonB [Hymenobacter sp. YIM 151858-1]UYZ60954.1 energy transducer TonB [Hymenobacter sp. YIM 151858-1]